MKSNKSLHSSEPEVFFFFFFFFFVCVCVCVCVCVMLEVFLQGHIGFSHFLQWHQWWGQLTHSHLCKGEGEGGIGSVRCNYTEYQYFGGAADTILFNEFIVSTFLTCSSNG